LRATGLRFFVSPVRSKHTGCQCGPKRQDVAAIVDPDSLQRIVVGIASLLVISDPFE
jgi:hypothetical protein